MITPLRFALWDRLGIAASTLCLAHCLLLPIVAAALPAFGLSWVGEGAVHTALGVAIASIAMLAFVPGYRRHRRGSVPTLAAIGLVLLVLGVIAETAWMHEIMGSVSTTSGSVMLIAAHGLNRTFCRRCRTCAETPQCDLSD